MSSNKSEQTVVITDTSCLIILDKLGRLSVLHQLFATVLTTPEIAAEYGQNLPDWIVVLSVRNKSLHKKFLMMTDPGEASAIALAHEIENQFLITDDLEARRIALKVGLSVIGTIGVLIRAKAAGHIDLIKPLIDQMRQTNFRISDELYKTALLQSGE